MVGNFLDKMFVQFWLTWKYFRRVETYGLEPEFCALSEYGLKNVVSVFIQEQWRNLWKAWKISLDRKFLCTFSYFNYCDSKLQVGTFITLSAGRAKSALQNVLFEFFMVIRQDISIFVFPTPSVLRNWLFDQKTFYTKRSSSKNTYNFSCVKATT